MFGMSLRDFETVDIVMRVPGSTAHAALIAYDTEDVPDEAEREALLGRKLAYYLEFVHSGRFRNAYPELAKHLLSIEVVCLFPPTNGMRQIESIGGREGKCSIPVNVTTDQEFRSRMGLKPRPS